MSAHFGKRICLWAAFVVSVWVSIAGGSDDAQPPDSATSELLALSDSLALDDADKIRALIDAGANVDVKNKYGVTPL